MEKVTLYVPGINCMHCVHTISTELMELEGVENVQADSETKMVNVDFVAPATTEKVKDLMTEINYPPAE